MTRPAAPASFTGDEFEPTSAIPAAPRSSPQLTDGGAIVLALGAAVGAWVHRPVPVLLVVVAAATVLFTRRPAALVVAILLAASWLGARSYAGLTPVEAKPFEGVVTLVGDPSPTPYGERVDVRVAHKRVELSAGGSAAGAVRASLTGERVRVSGSLSPSHPGSDWLIPRHVVGRLAVTHAERVDGGAPPWRAANRFRRLLERGAEALPLDDQALYGGFVLGDDRNQTPEVVDDFRGAGLTHLLVVSGQNVAFTLVLVRPLMQRLGWRGRWALTIAVVGAFGLVTRFEPSVLRAAAMTAVAVTAGAVGRPASGLRTLGLAVTALVLIDPLLVRSVGFQLSCGASLGIVLLAERVSARIPGPRPLAEALGVTIAAQIGVAPVLIPLSNGLPVVSLAANPLTVPIAGLVTTWGLPAGVVAGLVGGRVARLVLLPVGVMISWVASVARIAAGLPLGAVGWPHLAVLVGAFVLAGRSPPVRIAAVPLIVVALIAPAVALRHSPALVRGDGFSIHRAGGATVVVVDATTQPLTLLESLRRAGVRRVDILVTDGANADDVARAIRHRWVIGRAVDARDGPAQRLGVGTLVVTVEPPAPPDVAIVPAGSSP